MTDNSLGQPMAATPKVCRQVLRDGRDIRDGRLFISEVPDVPAVPANQIANFYENVHED